MKRAKERFLILALIISGLIIIELGCMVIIRIWPEADIAIDVENGWRFEPGDFYYRPHHYYALEANPASDKTRINSYGLTGKEVPLEKEPGEYRIACLGGSTTEGDYPRLLEHYLQKIYPDRKIRVINGGIGTYTTAETLIAYLFKISYLDPDLLIIYHATNDVFPAAYYSQRYPDYRQHRVMWRSELRASPRWLYRMRRYSNLAKVVYFMLFPERPHIWDYSLNPLELSPEEALKNVERDSYGEFFRNNLERLITLARSEGRDVLLLTFILSERNDKAMKLGVARFNDIIRELSKNKVYLFDLERYYRQNMLRRDIFMDACHFTGFGNRWVSRLIANFIRDSGIVE